MTDEKKVVSVMDVDATKLQTAEALYVAIAAAASDVKRSGAAAPSKASALRNLAVAFRAVSGGPQPGSGSSDD